MRGVLLDLLLCCYLFGPFSSSIFHRTCLADIVVGSCFVRGHGLIERQLAFVVELSLVCLAMNKFGRFLQVQDLALQDYIAVKSVPVYVPHTAGRYQKKRFRKAQCPIVERRVHTVSPC